MKQKLNKNLEIIKKMKTHISEMVVIDHFDLCAIRIAPSLLKSKLQKIWRPAENFTRIGASFTFAVSLLAALITADFKNVGFSGETWRAFFLIIFIIFSLAFLIDLALFAWNWNRGKLITIEKFVEELISSDNK